MRALTLAWLMGAMAALSACGGGGGGGGGGGDDGGDDPTTGETYHYVISTASFGAGGATKPGFNLDNSTTNVCNDAVDYTSPAPDSESGVDNQLGALAAALESLDLGDEPIDLAQELVDGILEGKVLLVFRVAGVDSLTSDTDVKVSAYLTDLDGGGVPDANGSELAGGQKFNVKTGGTIVKNASGSITDGRLSVDLDSLGLAIPVSSFNTEIVITLADVRVKFDISATALTNGNLGGSVPVDDALSELMSFLDAAKAMDKLTDVSFSIIEPVVTGHADLNQVGGDCQDVSAGLSFKGASAEAGTGF